MEDDEVPVKCPYSVGMILDLFSEGEDRLTVDNDHMIRCKITRFFEPPTLSCVMEVELLAEKTQNSQAVLKLFDRRFASQLRSDYKVGPLTIAKEKAFSDFVKSGRASEFLERLRNDDDFEESEEGWDMGQNETYLYDLCHDMYKTELEVYKKLQKLQGQETPFLLAQVRLQAYYPEEEKKFPKEQQPSSSNKTPDSSKTWSRERQSSLEQEKSTSAKQQKSTSAEARQSSLGQEEANLSNETQLSAVETTSTPTTESFEVEGLLLECIEGYTLSEIAEMSPREDWGKICDEAVRVVRLLDDYSIRNEDVRPSNIMVSETSSGSKYRIVMLDFAQCVLQAPEESEEQWNRAKWVQDEEGAVGLVMKHKLKKLGYDWPFCHSNKFLQWAPGEND